MRKSFITVRRYREETVKGALAVLDKVIKRGIKIGEHGNHKLRQKETVTFAAPVELNGVRGNMAVVINKRGKTYYAHRIVLPDGTQFVFDEKKTATQGPERGVTQKSSLAEPTSVTAINTIPQSNTKSKYSQRDSSEGLTKEEARAQAQAYTVLKAENAYYRERWEYWKNQTRKTKQATVRKADTDRYARYLVNLHDAKEADIDWVKERLKALGDYFVQHDKDSLDYDEMWDMAWEIATEIAENAEAYEDMAETFGVDVEDVKDSIKRAEIYMSAADIKALPEGFRRRYRGKIHISSDADRGVDSYMLMIRKSLNRLIRKEAKKIELLRRNLL